MKNDRFNPDRWTPAGRHTGRTTQRRRGPSTLVSLGDKRPTVRSLSPGTAYTSLMTSHQRRKLLEAKTSLRVLGTGYLMRYLTVESHEAQRIVEESPNIMEKSNVTWNEVASSYSRWSRGGSNPQRKLTDTNYSGSSVQHFVLSMLKPSGTSWSASVHPCGSYCGYTDGSSLIKTRKKSSKLLIIKRVAIPENRFF